MMAGVLTPDVARGREFGTRLERLLQRRRLQHDSFVERAKVWESGRPPAAGPVEFPRDMPLVIGLGVPCEDCLVLVYEQGQLGGTLVADVKAELEAVARMRGDSAPTAVVAGHEVFFGMVPGVHWALLVAARCHL